MSSRRQFVRTTAAAGAALALTRYEARAEQPVTRADAPLKILVLGGTGFTGPHQVNYAVQRGHQVTVFNRGRRQADIPASVRHLTGDRNLPNGAGVEALKGNETWDVVIDIPTTNPNWVRDAATALKGRVGQYIFVSTISVYAEPQPKAWGDESIALLEYKGAKDPFGATPQEVAAMGYGEMKVVSEHEAERHFPGRTTIVRPGLIVGPGDTSDRFTYWPMRIARGGEVLAPGDGTDPVQIIDARDLAEWIIRLAENKTFGTFNATGPRSPLTMGEMVAGIRAAMPGSLDVRFTWVPSEFLTSKGVSGWTNLPVWVPSEPGNEGWGRTSIEKAVAAGLTFRPLADTAKATLDWHNARPQAERVFPRLIKRPDGSEVMSQMGLSPDR
ncbi:MAG TPA: NAD-dependent epimerase/dehydratase family protein, partial [Longimicrobiales bacterium]